MDPTDDWSWNDTLANAWDGSGSASVIADAGADPSYTFPSSSSGPTTAPPAGASAGAWYSSLKDVAQSGLGFVKTVADIRGSVARTSADVAATNASVDIARQRADADRAAAAQQIRLDSALGNLRAQSQLAAAKASTFLTSPTGALVVVVLLAVAWKFFRKGI